MCRFVQVIVTDFADNANVAERHPVDLDLGALGARPPKVTRPFSQ